MTVGVIMTVFVAIVILVLFVAIYCYNRDKVWMWLAFLVSIDKGDRGIEKMIDNLLCFEPSNLTSRKRFLKRLNGLKKRLKRHSSQMSDDYLKIAITKIEKRERELIHIVDL